MLKVCTTASLSEDAAIHASNGSEFGQLLKRGIHSPEASATVGFWICCTLLYSHNSLVVQGMMLLQAPPEWLLLRTCIAEGQHSIGDVARCYLCSAPICRKHAFFVGTPQLGPQRQRLGAGHAQFHGPLSGCGVSRIRA